MSGYSRLYVLGGEGGYMGADGVNPIGLFILVGDGNRQWLEPHYVDPSFTPLGGLKTLIPTEPDHPDMLLDACIAFAPQLFESCPSMPSVDEQLGKAEFLDFELEKSAIPRAWAELREEARPVFEGLNLWRADFVRLDGDK
jgi:hypothetical protein